MIRAGIIGWGENGKKIAEALHFKLKDTEVVGVATDDSEGRDFAMRKMGLKHVFSNYNNLLELHQIDVIVICSDGDMHLTHVEKVLATGSNVFIDHPLSSNVEDCHKIEKLVDNYPSFKSTVAFPRRFDTKLRQVQKEIAEGKLGQIVRVECNTYESIPVRKDDSSIPKVTKGIFMDLMLQDIDMVKWLTGSEYYSVYAMGNAKKYPSLARQNDADSAVALARMSQDIVVNFTCSRVTHQGTGFELKVVGTLGEINISKLDQKDTLVESQEGKPYYFSQSSDRNEYIALLEDYISAIKFGNRISYKLEDATVATGVAVAMTKSFLLGQEVILKQ